MWLTCDGKNFLLFWYILNDMHIFWPFWLIYLVRTRKSPIIRRCIYVIHTKLFKTCINFCESQKRYPIFELKSINPSLSTHHDFFFMSVDDLPCIYSAKSTSMCKSYRKRTCSFLQLEFGKCFHRN